MEIWNDIEGYEGLYQVSNFGRVKSYDFKRITKSSVSKFYKGKILKGFVNNLGYLCFDLYCNNKRKNVKAHSLVASAFIRNKNHQEVVNHKDGNKLNNHFENLEWVSQKQNVIHAFDKRLLVRRGFDVLNLQTGIFYESIGDAHRSGLIKWSLPQFKKMINNKIKNTTDFCRV
jgi:hypothetical protein